jgi:DNA polymerase-3 subunit delta
MVAIKTNYASAFLAAPDPKVRAVLIYGNDAGLVRERAVELARTWSGREQGEVVQLGETDLDQDPDRLAVELQTRSLFGGRPIVRVGSGRRVTAAVLKPLLEASILEGRLIVEAGSLRPDDALRVLFERSGSAAAIACYPDEGRALEALVREVLREHRLGITPEALHVLTSRLGADRALSRTELDKLALYARGKPRIEIEDVDAIVGDVSELALDRVALAAGSGEADRALLECDKLLASGTSPQAVIRAVQSHFLRLHRLAAALREGRTMDDALKQLRPPLHFKHKPIIEAQLRSWTPAALGTALSAIAETATRARLTPDLERPIAEKLLLALAGMARRQPARERA